jgi:hypothetical protein
LKFGKGSHIFSQIFVSTNAVFSFSILKKLFMCLDGRVTALQATVSVKVTVWDLPPRKLMAYSQAIFKQSL